MSHPDRIPRPVVATIAILVFLAISAIPSGIVMLVAGTDAFPAEWLEELPIVDSFLIPGLLLGLGFGVGSAVTAYGMLSKRTCRLMDPIERTTGHHWSWIATMALGVGMMTWIGIQLFYLSDTSILQAIYGVVGVELLLLPLTPAVRGHSALRRPWHEGG